MTTDRSRPIRTIDEDAALRRVLEGTAGSTGDRFFHALVEALADLLGVHGAWVTELEPCGRRLRALAFRLGGGWVDEYAYDVTGTPCAPVVEGATLAHVEENIVSLYPGDNDLAGIAAVSFMAVPLQAPDGTVLGHLAVVDDRPMPFDARIETILRIFGGRAAAELRRVWADRAVREREARLRALVDGAMDGILELDAGGVVTLANPSAGRVFRGLAAELPGRGIGDLLEPDSAARLRDLAAGLFGGDGPAQAWVAGGLEVRGLDGTRSRAEATLSRVDGGPDGRLLLVIRDVEERLAAERRIRDLREEAARLRDELRATRGPAEILGDSPAVQGVLAAIAQVGPTDATVLVTGETGTGKELVARAVHAAGRRGDGPIVEVNCAALPANLVESELFGHEKGAFTGAVRRREGRFEQADGGTLFLDEVGELPLELQPKLLRVLQEGEVQPLGGSRTVSVDVRVVAATHRDLLADVAAGRFREDLYYRLAVFPIAVPPLRERGDDVVLLARAFAARIAAREGRVVAPLEPADERRLRAYDWPGNVRELGNVIERAVITARDGRLDLARVLTGATGAARRGEAAGPQRVRTEDEMRRLERENLRRALEEAGGRVGGAGGAADLVGIPASTFRSRLKVHGIDPDAVE